MRLAFTFLLAASASTLSAQGTTIGSVTTQGSGCVFSGNQILELFATGTFDLTGTSLSFFPNGNGSYVTVPNSGIPPLPFGAGTSTDTGSGDDTVVGPFSLGFNYPLVTGGTSNSIDVGSNGHVMLVSGTGGSDRCCDGDAALIEALAEGESFTILGTDLQPAYVYSYPPYTYTYGAGNIWFDTAPGVAYVTWDGIAEFGYYPPYGSNLNTVQMQIEDNGTVHLVYVDVNVQASSILVGYTSGGGQPAGPSRDLGSIPVDGGNGVVSIPLGMNSSSIPGIGSTTVFDLTDVPASGVFGGLLLGSGSQPAPLDLALIGMEGGCFLQTLADIPVAIPATVTPPTGTASLPIGTDPGSAGLTFSLQAVVAAPGVNTLGAIVSNEVLITIGDFSENPANSISVTLSGGNTFNSDTTSGFFNVRHNDPARAAIASVQFDLPAGGGEFFDVDQTAMADRFDAGMSTVTGCQNTYRNGTEATTGLVFAGTTLGAAACGSLETGATYTGTSPRQIRFDFANFDPGDSFELDIDTDGAAATTTGGGLGPLLTVTITLTDATVLTGTLTTVSPTVSQIVF